jgi:hypothetical protein
LWLVIHLRKQQSITLCLDLRNNLLMIMKVTLCKGFLILSHGQVISVEFESECRHMSINESDDVLGWAGMVVDWIDVKCVEDVDDDVVVFGVGRRVGGGLVFGDWGFGIGFLCFLFSGVKFYLLPLDEAVVDVIRAFLLFYHDLKQDVALLGHLLLFVFWRNYKILVLHYFHPSLRLHFIKPLSQSLSSHDIPKQVQLFFIQVHTAVNLTLVQFLVVVLIQFPDRHEQVADVQSQCLQLDWGCVMAQVVWDQSQTERWLLREQQLLYGRPENLHITRWQHVEFVDFLQCADLLLVDCKVVFVKWHQQVFFYGF